MRIRGLAAAGLTFIAACSGGSAADLVGTPGAAGAARVVAGSAGDPATGAAGESDAAGASHESHAGAPSDAGAGGDRQTPIATGGAGGGGGMPVAGGNAGSGGSGGVPAAGATSGGTGGTGGSSVGGTGGDTSCPQTPVTRLCGGSFQETLCQGVYDYVTNDGHHFVCQIGGSSCQTIGAQLTAYLCGTAGAGGSGGSGGAGGAPTTVKGWACDSTTNPALCVCKPGAAQGSAQLCSAEKKYCVMGLAGDLCVCTAQYQEINHATAVRVAQCPCVPAHTTSDPNPDAVATCG